jgi:Transposase DDE domain
VNADLDALATALYVAIDDALAEHPEWCPQRPAVGIAPKLSDSELLTLAVIQALLGFTSEARFIRHAQMHLHGAFPYLPNRPGYNKRLRRSGHLMQHVTAHLSRACPSYNDDLWLADSTPVECGRSRETAKRSDLVGFATYGYCASHSRFFWGLRLHLLTTASGLPVAFALAPAKQDERDTTLQMIEMNPDLHRVNQTIIADKGYRSAQFETELNNYGITLIRPATRTEKTRSQTIPPDHRVSKPNTQSPTRPRTPRRPHPTRRLRTGTAAASRPHRRHMAQRNHRPPRTRKVPNAVRPLRALELII